MEPVPGLPCLGSSSAPHARGLSEPGLPPSLDHSGCFHPSHPSAGSPERRWQGPGGRDILGKKDRKDWRFQGPRRLGSLGVKGGLSPSHTPSPSVYTLKHSCRQWESFMQVLPDSHMDEGRDAYLQIPICTCPDRQTHMHMTRILRTQLHTESHASPQTQTVKPKALVLWQMGLSSPRESPQQLVPALREGENGVH